MATAVTQFRDYYKYNSDNKQQLEQNTPAKETSSTSKKYKSFDSRLKWRT